MEKQKLKRPGLTELQKINVEEMFFGPYLDEWKVNGVVDNSANTIALRLGVTKRVVTNYINSIENYHFKKVIKTRNKQNNG